MLRAEKIERLSSLKESLERTPHLLLVSFSQVSVPDITTLRRELKEMDARYIVVKNRIFKKAIADSNLEPLADNLTGPTALILTGEDPISPSKKIMDFNKDHPEMVFKGGYVEGKILDVASLVTLSKMPSREDLIAKLLFLLQSPLRRLVVSLNAPLQQCVSTLKAVAEKQ